MSVSSCQHCNNAIPAEFSSMPVCYICGGDLKATPSGQSWSSIDVKVDNSRICKSCGTEVKSVLAIDCPKCGSELVLPGKKVEDFKKENQVFEEAVQATNQKSQFVPPITIKRENEANKENQRYSRNQDLNIPINSGKYGKKKNKEGFLAKLLRLFGFGRD